MSEWEEFTAYAGLIADAKREERERIITAIKPLISKGYFPPEEVGTGDWLEIEFSELVELIKGDKQVSIHVHKNEPYKIENGRLWYNPDDGETRIYNDGIWEIVQTKSADYLRGVEEERERIRINILDRVQDLMSCNKNDDCNEWGQHIEGYIQEWLDDGENK